MTFKPLKNHHYQLGFYAETSGLMALFYPYSLSEYSTLERMDNNLLRSTCYFYQEKKEDKIEKQYRVKINYHTKTIHSTGLKKTRQWHLETSLPTDKLSFAFIIGDDIEQGKTLRSPLTMIDGKKTRLILIKELTNIPYSHYRDDDSPFRRDDHTQYRRFFLEDDGESMEIWLSKKQRHIPYKILFTGDSWTVYYELSQLQWIE